MHFTKEMKHRVIIYTPGFDDKIGGVMALFGLGHALRKIGVNVSIWQWNVEPRLSFWLRWRVGSWITQVMGGRSGHREGEMRTWPEKPLAIAAPWEISNAVVLYPEIIDGNPLKARRVARWFLNKPGLLTGNVDYGSNELYFFYDKIFDDSSINPFHDNLLTILTVMSLYRQTNFGLRQGSCYVLRKGKARAPDPVTLDGPVIDDLGHEEIAEIFNRCEYCVSYDPHTMFSFYAALCGCKSVVVPEVGVPKEHWDPEGKAAYGVAYGFEDLPNAERMKPMLATALAKMERQNLQFAEKFREQCQKFFFGPDQL